VSPVSPVGTVSPASPVGTVSPAGQHEHTQHAEHTVPAEHEEGRHGHG
jgi:hypothetical protein